MLRKHEISTYSELLTAGGSLSAFHGRPMTGPGTRATMKHLQFMHSIRFPAVSGLKPTLTNIVWPHCGQSMRMITDSEELFSGTDASSGSRGSSDSAESTAPEDKASPQTSPSHDTMISE